MTDAIVCLLTLVGFLLLFLAMPRHRQDWLNRHDAPASARGFRIAGGAAMALAFVVAGHGFGWGYGAIAWAGWLTVAATTVVALDLIGKHFLKGIGS